MKKAYFVNIENHNCWHNNYEPYSQDQGLIALGYALLAIHSFKGKEKYNTFVNNTDTMQESFDLRCCDTPEMAISFTRDKKDFLLEVQYGYYTSPDSENPEESDIFVRKQPYPPSASWDFESKQWITKEPEVIEESIRIKQSAFIQLGKQFEEIKDEIFVIELIQHDDETFSLFYIR